MSRIIRRNRFRVTWMRPVKMRGRPYKSTAQTYSTFCAVSRWQSLSGFLSCARRPRASSDSKLGSAIAKVLADMSCSNMRTVPEVSIYRTIGRDTFPRPVQLVLKAVSWPWTDIALGCRAVAPSPPKSAEVGPEVDGHGERVTFDGDVDLFGT